MLLRRWPALSKSGVAVARTVSKWRREGEKSLNGARKSPENGYFESFNGKLRNDLVCGYDPCGGQNK